MELTLDLMGFLLGSGVGAGAINVLKEGDKSTRSCSENSQTGFPRT